MAPIFLGIIGGLAAYFALKNSDPKKAKIYLIIGIAVSGLWGLGLFTGDPDETTEPDRESELIKKSGEIVEFVQNYSGKEGKGVTILESLTLLLIMTYPNEDILDNPTTETYWFAIETEQGIYQTVFKIKTYSEDTELIWYVDTNSNSIFAGNQGARDILDIVETFDE